MEREQIIKALECCANAYDCFTCDNYKRHCIGGFRTAIAQNALSLIKELTEENDRLSTALEKYDSQTEVRISEEYVTIEAYDELREENERLRAEGDNIVKFPCKVGSEVYFADIENGSSWEGNVVSFCLDAAHLWFNCHYKCGLNMWHPIEDFGKTLFLTQKESEKALKGE